MEVARTVRSGVSRPGSLFPVLSEGWTTGPSLLPLPLIPFTRRPNRPRGHSRVALASTPTTDVRTGVHESQTSHNSPYVSVSSAPLSLKGRCWFKASSHRRLLSSKRTSGPLPFGLWTVPPGRPAEAPSWATRKRAADHRRPVSTTGVERRYSEVRVRP